jgi:RNA polymerase sigma-54 factor
MVLLQPRLNVKLSQRQILTPGLVQMVSVLALNKLELKDMINAEMVENPVLEELEDAVPLLDDVGRQEEERDRIAAQATAEEKPVADEKKDPFEEIDFGSFFQDYLDPGYRSRGEMEEIEKPSFENFLSKPGNLTDHLRWQLGAISVSQQVNDAAEVIIGNLSEDGYLIASDEELLGITPPAAPDADVQKQAKIVTEAQAIGIDADVPAEPDASGVAPEYDDTADLLEDPADDAALLVADEAAFQAEAPRPEEKEPAPAAPAISTVPVIPASFTQADLHEALEIVRQFDPPGVGCRDLRECLLYQLRYHLAQLQHHRNGNGANEQVVKDAMAVVDQHLRAVTLKQFKEIGRAIGRPVEAVLAALDYVRTLDPRPGLQYNKVPPRLIEPDVAFIKHGDEWLVIMNDEDMPQLRLNPAYKRLLTRDGNDRDTRN